MKIKNDVFWYTVSKKQIEQEEDPLTRELMTELVKFVTAWCDRMESALVSGQALTEVYDTARQSALKEFAGMTNNTIGCAAQIIVDNWIYGEEFASCWTGEEVGPVQIRGDIEALLENPPEGFVFEVLASGTEENE